MDVLKDLTDGLRGNDGDGREENDQNGADARREGAARSSTADSASESADSTREDVHLCSFCETEFDAERDTCPECDARIVLRGAR